MVSVSGVDLATYVDGEQDRPWIILSNSLAADHSSWYDSAPAPDPEFPRPSL